MVLHLATEIAIVSFGVIWIEGRGALSVERQRQRFADLGIDGRRVVTNWIDLPPLRDGDEVIVCSPLLIAPDVMGFALRYRDVMRQGASFTLDGVFTVGTWDEFPEVLEKWQKARRLRQTEAARNAKKPPRKRGPRPLQDAAAKREFSRLWRDPNVTQADLSRRYGVAWTTIWRWGKMLELGEKAKS